MSRSYITVSERAADGEIAADKRKTEWTSEGEQKEEILQVCETELILRNQRSAYDGTY